MFRRRRRDEQPGRLSPLTTYNDLRAMALHAANSGALPSASAEHPDVSGVVVDIPTSGGTATIVALNDNTTSLYTSTGGGTIGAGEHANVAAATHGLLTSAQQHLDAFTSMDDGALPASGSVRLHVFSSAGPRMVDLPEDAFWGRVDHPLMPVIAAVQGVMSSMQNMRSPST